MEPGSTASSDRPGLIAMAIVLAAGFVMAALLPVTASEAYAFVHFVKPPVRDLLGVFDPANHVLVTLLMKRSVGLLRLSAFSLRVPGLLGLALYLGAVNGLLANPRRLRWVMIAVAGAAYLGLEYGTPGTGVGLAMALWLGAVQRSVAYLKGNHMDGLANLNLAGVCLGLSVAANFCLLIPSLLLALALGLAIRRQWAPWTERMLVTATVTAFLLLVLPFSHASAGELAKLVLPPPVRTARAPEDLTGLVAVLRRDARGRTVRIAADAWLVPVLEFYQARYREGGWRISPFPSPADYYVMDRARLEIPGQMLYRGRTVVLTH